VACSGGTFGEWALVNVTLQVFPFQFPSTMIYTRNFQLWAYIVMFLCYSD